MVPVDVSAVTDPGLFSSRTIVLCDHGLSATQLPQLGAGWRLSGICGAR